MTSNAFSTASVADSDSDCIHPLDRRLTFALGVVLLLITVLVFAKVVGFKLLLWDDDQHIVENEYFNPLTWRGLLHFWGYSHIYMYIPVAYDFWGLEVWIAKFFPSSDPKDHFNPAVFHLGNLLIHLANVTLVYRLLLRLVRHAPAAFCGALLFAIHPLQVESVCWVGETRGTLATLFSLLALHKYLNFIGVDPTRGLFAEAAYEPPNRRRCDYVWATIFFIAALLSKPSAMTWPAIVFVVEVFLLRGSWRRSLKRLAPWFVAAAVIAGLTKYYQKTEFVATTSRTEWSERPQLIGDTYAFYLRKLVWPSEPSFDYGRTPFRAAKTPYYRWAWLLPTLALTFLLLDRKRRRLWLGCFAFFVLAIAPVSGIVPFLYQSISTVADRYMYVPLIGFGLMLAAWLAMSRSGGGYALIAMLLTIAAARAYEETALWRDDYVLFNNGLRVNPESYVAELSLGHRCRADGRLDEAERHYRRLLELRPDIYSIRNLVALKLLDEKKYDEAIVEFQEVLKADEKYTDALTGLGRVMVEKERWDDAEDYYRRAIKMAPKSAEPYLLLGEMNYRREKFDDGDVAFRKAIELGDKAADVHLRYGQALAKDDRDADAVKELDRAAALIPQSAAARREAALVHLRLKQYPQAIEHAEAATRLSPRDFTTWETAGQALVAAGRTDEARSRFETALKLISPGSSEAARVRDELASLSSPAPERRKS